MAAEPSLMQRGLARFARVEPRESAAVIASFLLFFFVLDCLDGGTVTAGSAALLAEADCKLLVLDSTWTWTWT